MIEVGFGDPPCSVTGDHHWHGSSVCSSCGERLRCICGRFVRADGIDEHVKVCATVEREALEEHRELESRMG